MLTTYERQLLQDALLRHAPDLTPLVEEITIRRLTDREREALRGALAQELLETGLAQDEEPNERGMQIDRLIGRLGGF